MWKYTEAEELSTPLENVDDVWINYDTDVLKGWSFSCNKTSSLSFVPSCLTPVLISPFWTVCRARPKWIFMQFPNHTFGEKKLHFLIVCVEMMEVFWGEKVYAETNGSEENLGKHHQSDFLPNNIFTHSDRVLFWASGFFEFVLFPRREHYSVPLSANHTTIHG